MRPSIVSVTMTTAYSPVEFRDTYLICPERDTRLLHNVFLVPFVTESLQVNGLMRATSGVHSAVLLEIKSSGKRSCVSGLFPDISVDVSVFIFRVKQSKKSDLNSLTLKAKAVRSFEPLRITDQTIQLHLNPQSVIALLTMSST